MKKYKVELNEKEYAVISKVLSQLNEDTDDWDEADMPAGMSDKERADMVDRHTTRRLTNKFSKKLELDDVEDLIDAIFVKFDPDFGGLKGWSCDAMPNGACVTNRKTGKEFEIKFHKNKNTVTIKSDDGDSKIFPLEGYHSLDMLIKDIAKVLISYVKEKKAKFNVPNVKEQEDFLRKLVRRYNSNYIVGYYDDSEVDGKALTVSKVREMISDADLNDMYKAYKVNDDMDDAATLLYQMI